LGVLYYVLINLKQMGAVWAGFREAHFHRVSEIQKCVSAVQKRAYDEHNLNFKGLVSRSCR
jgi:maltose-binding protein MalE